MHYPGDKIYNLSMSGFLESINAIFYSSLSEIAAYLPKFISGFLILFIGLVVASLLKDLIKIFFRYFKLEKWLEVVGISKQKEIEIWPQMISEIIRWLTIFIFLISAVEIWGVPKVGEVLNQLLNFLPNVLLAVVIGWIGLTAGKISFNVVRHSIRGLEAREVLVLGNVAKYSIIFFTILIVLTQLGVAADLVRILFTGIVAMLALALGLAFGLGGKDEAQTILKELRKKLQK